MLRIYVNMFGETTEWNLRQEWGWISGARNVGTLFSLLLGFPLPTSFSFCGRLFFGPHDSTTAYMCVTGLADSGVDSVNWLISSA